MRLHLTYLVASLTLLFLLPNFGASQTSSLLNTSFSLAATPTHSYNSINYFSSEGNYRENDSLSATGRFLTPSKNFNKKRFWLSAGTAATIYSGFSIALWEAWYKDYPTGAFQTIDDSGEWLGMDKAGHIYTAFHYSRWAYQGLRWSGTPKPRALLLSTATSLLLQSTIEVMDGFSESWGFSWYDMAANAAGTGLFAAQQGLWQQQRINMKVSSARVRHADDPIFPSGEDGPASTLQNRADQLYGTTPWNRFIKDYNAQTIWLTTNPVLLFGHSTKFDWIDLAIGYSTEDVLGAYGNNWREGQYVYNGTLTTDRRRQYAISLDINFEKIRTNSPALKTLLHLLNHVKFPAPAVVIEQNRGLKWNWLYY